MSILDQGILENAPQPRAGGRGLTANQVNEEITRRLASYITQSRVTTLLDGKVDESDYNIEKSTIESRITENRNNINGNDSDITSLQTAVGTKLAISTFNSAKTNLENADTALGRRIDDVDNRHVSVDDFYIDVWPRYITSERLGGNIIFVFSHVPPKYQVANLITVQWDGVPVVPRTAWNPSTEYILFSIGATNLDNLRVALGASPNRESWQVQIRFFNQTVELGLENIPVLIDRG